jgi:hypothetical protein
MQAETYIDPSRDSKMKSAGWLRVIKDRQNGFPERRNDLEVKRQG